MKTKQPISLVLAIIFASSVVSGSVVYFATQLQAPPAGAADSNQIDMETLTEQIDKGIERYIVEQSKKQQQEQRQQEDARSEEASNVDKPGKDDYIRGEKDAEITLIEYSDYECPFCKRFHPTAEKLVEKYDGKVNWIYRHYPLSFHDPLATKQALAAECAGEQGGSDAYWNYTDKIFEMTTSNGRGMTEVQLFDIASDIGIDQAKLETCVEEEKHKGKVVSHMANAMAAGVTGTPGNILYNNKTGAAQAVHGAQPLSALEAVVEQLLSK